MTTTATFTVRGMTCDHCVRAVQSEVARIPGVTAATADLATGRLVVTADPPVDTAAVCAAVEEAGYEVAT